MGYDVHITRRENWFENGPEITLEEWLDVVAADPDMRHDGYAVANFDDGTALRHDDPSIAVWTAYSKHEHDGGMAWFRRGRAGNITVKNPDDEILRKMSVIATRLRAHVQGDEGEWYGANGAILAPENRPNYASEKESSWSEPQNPDPHRIRRAPFDDGGQASVAKPWWKLW